MKNTAFEAKIETLMYVQRAQIIHVSDETYRIAYNMLLTHIPANTIPHHTALRREDYPNVRFWTRQDWNAATQEQVLEIDQPNDSESFPDLDAEEGDESNDPCAPSPAGPAHARGKHRSSQGINVAMKYIELEDGSVVDGYRAAEIRRFARSLWVQMALNDKLPKVWGDADAASLATYNESMAQRFQELRLCASDWKANLVATDNYPSWRYNWLRKQNKNSITGKHTIDTDLSKVDPSSVKRLKIGGPKTVTELLAQTQGNPPDTVSHV